MEEAPSSDAYSPDDSIQNAKQADKIRAVELLQNLNRWMDSQGAITQHSARDESGDRPRIQSQRIIHQLQNSSGDFCIKKFAHRHVAHKQGL